MLLSEAEEFTALASAVEACIKPRFVGQIGAYIGDSAAVRRVAHLIPPGSKIKIPAMKIGSKANAAGQRSIAAKIRELSTHTEAQNIKVERMPLAQRSSDSASASMLLQEKFNEAILLRPDESIATIAASWPGGALSLEDVLDKLLLTLHDALFLQQATAWTRQGVANLAADDTLNLAHWFLKGQAVGNRPIFDGICAFCGALLHGDQNQNTALSNKCTY